ncbi:MAG: hypothetical protein ACK6EB_40620, partial [Planctomyces sp.]
MAHAFGRRGAFLLRQLQLSRDLVRVESGAPAEGSHVSQELPGRNRALAAGGRLAAEIGGNECA